MQLTKKQIYISLFSITIIVLILWGFWPDPISVRVDEARSAALEVTIEEEGITRVMDRYTVYAPVTGYRMRINHEVGDTIRSNQKLFIMQPVPDLLSARQRDVAEAQLKAARARLQQARENFKLSAEERLLAEKELQRIENLHRSEIGSLQELDNAEMAAKRALTRERSAEFAVQVAEHEVEGANSAVQAFQMPGGREQLDVRSPVSGRILKINDKSESSMQMGAPVLEIGDPGSIEIKVDLLSTDAVAVEKGTRVRIKRWGSDTILDGIVKVVEPSGYTRYSALGVEEQRVPVIVDLLSPRDQWNTLGDGFRVVAEFIIWQGREVLQVPSSALFRVGDAWALFVVSNGKANLRKVQAGHQSGLQTEITGGIKEGERVMTHPDERIEDGVRVSIRD